LSGCGPLASVASFSAACLRRSFSTASAQAEVLARAARPRAATCLLRSFSASFARALPAVTCFIWSLFAGGSGDCTTTGTFNTGKSITGGLGPSTKRRETCEQVEHLKVWRSNPAIGVSVRLTPTRRISAPHATHRIGCRSPRENWSTWGTKGASGVKVWAETDGTTPPNATPLANAGRASAPEGTLSLHARMKQQRPGL
jgi:hypothetical protein